MKPLERITRHIQKPAARRALAGAGFLAVAALMSASIFATGPEAEPEVRSEKAWPVSVVAIEPGTLSPTFSAYGRVESSHVAHLRTDLIARVAAVHVKEGDWVYSGQALVSLDARELELTLTQQQANLAELEATLQSTLTEHELVEASTSHYTSMKDIARSKLTRHQDLMRERLISQSLLDEVTSQANQAEIQYQTHMRQLADFPNRVAAQQAAIARAQALVAQAELDLEKTRVTAPFAGPILGVFVAPGDRSNLGTPLLDIADAGHFEVRVQVPDAYGERFARHLERRSPITARPGGESAAPETALHLVRLSGQVRQGQSGLDAFFRLPVESGAPSTALGRMIELAITLPEEIGVVALPVQSIYENDRIYAVKDNRLDAITVERVGELETDDGQFRILVRSPELAAGQQIITTQLPRAITGLLVAPAAHAGNGSA